MGRGFKFKAFPLRILSFRISALTFTSLAGSFSDFRKVRQEFNHVSVAVSDVSERRCGRFREFRVLWGPGIFRYGPNRMTKNFGW